MRWDRAIRVSSAAEDRDRGSESLRVARVHIPNSQKRSLERGEQSARIVGNAVHRELRVRVMAVLIWWWRGAGAEICAAHGGGAGFWSVLNRDWAVDDIQLGLDVIEIIIRGLQCGMLTHVIPYHVYTQRGTSSTHENADEFRIA